MSSPVNVIKSHTVDGQPIPQLHRAVKHKFIMAKPYAEWRRGNIVTSDAEKNKIVISLLRDFVADRKSVMIFVERKKDVENLGIFQLSLTLSA